MMGFEDGTYGYEMEIIVQAGSPLKSVMDLKGRQIAFTQPTSNSGYKAPSVLLKSEFGLEPERDYRAIFSGKHENSVLGVINKDYEAAAVANSVLKRMIQRGAADEAKLRSIYRSKRFPTTAYGYVNNLHPDLAAKVREAFFSFKWEGSRLKREYEKETGTKFLPIRYKEHWAIIRQIDEAMGEMSPAR